MNTDPKLSAQSCGCDPGCEDYKCERHRSTPEPTIRNVIIKPTREELRDMIEDGRKGVSAPATTCASSPHGASVADARMISIGGGPTRATILPTDAAGRKKYPIASGVLDYFPDAIAALSKLSWQGNEQHNPGQPLHWARHKSTDEADTLMRHFLQRGTVDVDGIPHSVKVAWRALAMLQREIDGIQPKG